MANPDAATDLPGGVRAHLLISGAAGTTRWPWAKPRCACGMAEGEQPEGHMFLVGDSKTEHPAVDPDITKTRWVQSMSQDGGYMSFEITDLAATLEAADGDLPAVLSGACRP